MQRLGKCHRCGRPLSETVGTLDLAIGGQKRRVAGLRYVEPCVCGEGRQIPWRALEAIHRYFADHADETEVDVARLVPNQDDWGLPGLP